MEERDKLSIIIKHWIEHNRSHLEEYRRWAQRAAELGLERVKTRIDEAIHELSQSNNCLEEALKELKPL